MAIISQNDSLLSAAATSILGGKQLVSLTDPEEIKGVGIMYAALVAQYCPKANATKVANAISAGTPTINVFVNGIAFEVDEQKMVLYVVNTYDLSQLKNLYGDVNGAELPSGYFIVVASNGKVFADDTIGNLGMVAAPDVKNVETGKVVKEAVRVGDTVQGIMGVDGGYKGKVKRLTRDSRGKLQVVFVDDKGVERETPAFNVKKISESNVSERTMSVTYAQAISALAGSAEDEDISVIKRYADCVSIIFRMTPKEVMKDLLPESDTHR